MDLSHSPIDVKKELYRSGEADGAAFTNLVQIEENSLDHPDYVRIKSECYEWDNPILPTNLNEEIVNSGDIKLEKFSRENVEYCNTTRLSAEFDIKNERDRTVDLTSGGALDRTKSEHSSNLATIIDKVVKIENFASDICMSREDFEYVDTGELDIKTVIETDTPPIQDREKLGCMDSIQLNEELDNQHESEMSSRRTKICIHCNLTFKRKKLLDDHIIKKHPNFIASVTRKIHECTKCSFKTTLVSVLRDHQLKHPTAAANYKLSRCIHCNAAFQRKAALDNHLVMKHPNFIASVTRKIYECTKCNFKTTLRHYLDRHMLKHPETTANYEFSTCVHCKAEFKSKTGLDNHIVKKHPKFIASVTRKIYECTRCNFKTTVASHLDYHQLKHPETSANYKLRSCLHCEAAFKSRSWLDNHIVNKHPNFIASVTRKIHECTKCTFKTTLVRDFECHQLKHLETAANNYKFIS